MRLLNNPSFSKHKASNLGLGIQVRKGDSSLVIGYRRPNVWQRSIHSWASYTWCLHLQIDHKMHFCPTSSFGRLSENVRDSPSWICHVWQTLPTMPGFDLEFGRVVIAYHIKKKQRMTNFSYQHWQRPPRWQYLVSSRICSRKMSLLLHKWSKEWNHSSWLWSRLFAYWSCC